MSNQSNIVHSIHRRKEVVLWQQLPVKDQARERINARSAGKLLFWIITQIPCHPVLSALEQTLEK